MVSDRFGYSTALVFEREMKVNMLTQYGTMYKGKEGDHVNAVWYCFNVRYLDV